MSAGHHRRRGRGPEHRRPNALSVGICGTTGKAKFISRTDAKDTAKRTANPSRPFHCDVCGYWHLGGLYGHTREWHRTHHGRE